jgi:SAM-dependent methyltransferase
MYYNTKYGLVAKEMNYVPSPGFILRRSRILALIDTFPPGHLLEIGCGAGGIISDMARKKFKCIGVEISAEARILSKQLIRKQSLNIKIKSKFNLNWKNYFSYIFAFEVLEHIKNDAEALRHWNKSLKPGGILVMSVPALMSKWGIEDEVVGHFRRYTRKEVINKLKKSGFVLVCIENWGFPLVPLIRPIRKLKYKNYMGKEILLKGNYSKSSGNKISGINRGLESYFFPILETTVGRLIMTLFEKIQVLFKNTDLGDGYIVVAKKPYFKK